MKQGKEHTTEIMKNHKTFPRVEVKEKRKLNYIGPFPRYPITVLRHVNCLLFTLPFLSRSLQIS